MENQNWGDTVLVDEEGVALKTRLRGFESLHGGPILHIHLESADKEFKCGFFCDPENAKKLIERLQKFVAGEEPVNKPT